MKLTKSAWIKWGLLAIYLVLSYIYVLKIIRPELHYHVQQPPFLGIYEFFIQYIYYPGGIADYLATCILQFFSINWSGAAIIIFIALVLLTLTRFILNKIASSATAKVLYFLPFILSISLLNSYTFPYTIIVKALLIYLFVSIYLLFNKRLIVVPLFTLLAVAMYYVAGSGSFLAFSGSILLIEIHKQFNKKYIAYYLFIVALALLLPHISYNYIFNIPPDAKYFYFNPDLPKFISYAGNITYYIFWLSLPLIIIFNALCLFVEKKIKLINNRFELILTSLFIAIISIGAITINFRKHAKNRVLIDFYNYTEQWDKTIDVALSDPEYDVIINYHYIRAISNTNNFADSYFNYKQYVGIDGLFPDKINAKEIALLSSDYYYDLGYIGLSQLWANEALTVFHYSPRILKRLFTTNLIMGNYEEAKKYLSILNYNFLNQDFVNQYLPYVEDTTLILRDNVLMAKRKLSPLNIDVDENMPKRYDDLLNKNINNKMAYDHNQMYYLLKLDFAAFFKTLPIATKYYKKIPFTYELGAILYLAQKGDFNLINTKNFSEAAIATFSEFTSTLKEFKNNKEEAKRALQEKYGNTYLFYVMFDNPKITKYELKRQPINTHKY